MFRTLPTLPLRSFAAFAAGAAVTILVGLDAGDGRRGAGRAAAAPSAPAAVLVCDPSCPPATFAAGEIEKSLAAIGFSVCREPLDRPEGSPAGLRIVLATIDHGALRRGGSPGSSGDTIGPGPQGFRIEKRESAGGTEIRVLGADPAGTMYGGLELAERIRLDRSVDKLHQIVKSPHLARRGLKLNIPLDARTPSYDDTGDSAQANYAVMWDFAFWEEFLDEMARHRYNTLTLWNPHPFPSLVRLPDYPDIALNDVCTCAVEPVEKAGAWREPMFVWPEVFRHLKVVKKMTIDEKIAFWRRVMQRAKDRRIDVYFITWNVIVNAAEGKHGITPAQDNPRTIAYLRQCVRELLLTYPLLAGIGVTAGENMRDRKDEFSKEKWLWQTYGLGVLEAKRRQPGRTIGFIHRVWQTDVDEIVREFGSKYPDPFALGFKYARARLYSSTRPPFADELCRQMKPHGLGCWWNLRNDDVFNFRWGDPDYVRQFLLNLPPGELTAGYYVGSDGYVWGREFTSLQPQQPRALEIRKHWYNFMLWGRLGYEPALDRAFFVRVLKARFPEASAEVLYDAWQSASKIIPLVNRFHWRDWDFLWAVEGCIDQPKGFHTVDDFILGQPMEKSGLMSIPEYVDTVLLASTRPVGITPIRVAGELHAHARTTLDRIKTLRTRAPQNDRELGATLGDLEAMAHLGDYYAAKILGSVELCAYRRTKEAGRQREAVKHLEAAVQSWESYARVASSLYRPQLLARTRRLDWWKILEEVKKDVEIARAGPLKGDTR